MASPSTQASGKQMLRELASFPFATFENKFSRGASRIGLGSLLSRDELQLLYDAAFIAAMCNISFNGLGGCGGEIKPERERHRRNLEAQFMFASGNFYASAGAKALTESQRVDVARTFLAISIHERELIQ
jgi:hypothetical protein